jgi:uncharacterized protein YkwD
MALDVRQLAAFEREATEECGVGDEGLRRVAQEVLALKLAGSRLPEPDGIALAQRAAGEPHPWARAWASRAKGAAAEALLPELARWLGRATSARRCGAASGMAADGARVLAVVAVDALADLAPLPTRTRVGQWLTVEARLRAPARGGQVLVLGPTGPPRPLLTSVDRSTVRARFAADHSGAFTVQVMADTDSGPRPVLEASVFADVEPPQGLAAGAAPGESQLTSARDDSDALLRMLAAAREEAGQLPLVRDPRLDQVAREHCVRMSRAQELVHDAGDGDPDARLEARGLGPRNAGENVAHAPSLVQAGRALWASPSHRLNMLRAEFRRVGIGVVHADADVWVTETFAGD